MGMATSRPTFDSSAMQRALELALRGQGHVEPNPLVGAVIASSDGTAIVAEGWHARFGEAHAEVAALVAAGTNARGGTLYVTLEPCCHQGKTPPCTSAIIAAGIARVVVASGDPFPAVNGGGIAALQAAGVVVEVGLHSQEGMRLIAPFCKLVTQKKPWLIAKWAMSLDGRMATHPPDSPWISSEESRAIVHELRGRVDAIFVGIGTAIADDPLLTARPAGPRQPLRIVLDTQARLPLSSQLVKSARDIPLLVATGPEAPVERLAALRESGCHIWQGREPSRAARLESLLQELGNRRMTNVLVEGGSEVLGSLFAHKAIDEVWTFIAPKIIGGNATQSPLSGDDLSGISDASALDIESVAYPGGDIFMRGLLRYPLTN